MAEIATVIIKVDLKCCTCSKKIKKVLCKLQNRFAIQSIVYDEKNNTVTVSGPFNPECFIKKLRCLACKVIKDVQIKPKPQPPPPKPEPPPPKPEPPPPPKPEKPPPPKPEAVVKPPVCAFPPPGWPNCCYRPCPCFEPRDGCRRCCSCGWVCDVPSPPPPKPRPVPLPEAVVKPPVCAFPPPGWPNCCYRPCPCFEPRDGCRRCCSCGLLSGGPPPSAAGRPCYEVDGYKIVVEQEPCYSCSIM
ncbi:hypothetical protein OPV22_023579 [Ensete ventricosum]|uniref:HMA domain-containing protein n=1 Tax=Ensete ventricosum TaxID=4639 RepID=A0AAV8QT93_ENSVE|nr:hypothetical protein OPV22_023579 [Ensete ventricosum]